MILDREANTLVSCDLCDAELSCSKGKWWEVRESGWHVGGDRLDQQDVCADCVAAFFPNGEGLYLPKRPQDKRLISKLDPGKP